MTRFTNEDLTIWWGKKNKALSCKEEEEGDSGADSAVAGKLTTQLLRNDGGK